MVFKDFISKRRRLWHRHFIPSLIAGLVVAAIALVFDLTVSNVILFASVGASAVILTNSESHHLTKLRTVVVAYVIAIVISLVVYSYLDKFTKINNSRTIFKIHLSCQLYPKRLLVGETDHYPTTQP